MRPPSYMLSVVDRNVVMRRMTVFKPQVAPAVLPTLHATPAVAPAVLPTLHAQPLSTTSHQSQHNVARYNGKLLIPSLML